MFDNPYEMLDFTFFVALIQMYNFFFSSYMAPKVFIVILRMGLTVPSFLINK